VHTVTAFLYSGLGGRPFWNSALLAPRFLASAFVTGPAFIVLTLRFMRRRTLFHVPPGPIRTLVNVMRITVLVNLFMMGAEVFTEFYTGGSHTAAAQYLFFGLHGSYALVPWTWAAIAFNLTSAVILLTPSLSRRFWVLNLACVLAFAGVWIEKGMGLIVPGFIPSTLHEVVEYVPSLTEWRVTAGVWAFGLMIYTIALKVALPILSGQVRLIERPEDATSMPAE